MAAKPRPVPCRFIFKAGWGMVAHTFNPCPMRQRQVDLYECKACLVCTVRFRQSELHTNIVRPYFKTTTETHTTKTLLNVLFFGQSTERNEYS